MAEIKFCESCGSILELGICSNKRCPKANNVLTKWVINGMEIKFIKPVTFEEACDIAKDRKKYVSAVAPKCQTLKPYTG